MSALPPIAVFDLDGTLADTAVDVMNTLNVILEREGLRPLPIERANDLLGSGARALIERGFKVESVALDPARLTQLFEDFMEHYGAHLCEHTALYPGVVEALDWLEARGFKLAVCTNKMERHSVDLLAALGVGARFAFVAGRNTFAYSKPDPRHLLLTVEAAGGDPHRAIMIGDSHSDVDAARAANIPVVCVPFGYSAVPVAELKPDRIIEHFRDLPAAVADLVPQRAA